MPPVSDHIKDPELRRIAKAHHLDDWEWGWEGASDLSAVAMMEGAAVAIQSIYNEGRDIEVYVHQSGTMVIFGGAYLNYQINPDDEVEVEKDWLGVGNAMDWDDDPVVKKYKCKDRLTLSWDEGEEMFGEDDPD